MRAHGIRREMQREENGMLGTEEQGEELREMVQRKNEMAVEEVRLMAEGRMVCSMIWQMWRMGLLCRFWGTCVVSTLRTLMSEYP